MRKKYTIGWTIFCLALGLSHVSAQNRSAVDSLFFRGVRYFQESEFSEALNTFRFMDRVYPNNHRTTASLLLQGKALSNMKKYYEALEVLETLQAEHPGSEYIDDSIYEIGEIYYYLGMYKDCVREWLRLITVSRDPELLNKSARLSSRVMDYRMPDYELRELLKEVQDERGQAAVILRLAQRDIDNQRFQSARRIVQDFLNTYPESAYVMQMQQLLDQANALGRGFVKVGVILPLSGPDEQPAQQVLDGIEYALQNEGGTGQTKIELLVRDSRSSVLQAILAAQDLCQNEGVTVIIGDLGSEATAGVAAVAQACQVVLLSPVAMENGLTQIGDYIFQENGNIQTRAETLAEYAVEGLGLKTFGILYPADSYGQTMRDGFVNMVRNLGGEILEEKFYFEGATDVGPQFQAIRQAGLRRMLRDSLIIRVSEEDLELYKNRKDTLYTCQHFQDLVDSTDFQVRSIDGLFLPVYTADLQMILAKISEMNLRTRIFGGIPWHNQEMLEKATERVVLEGEIFFLTDFYVDLTDYGYYQFRDDFRQSMKKTPGKFAVFGYDMMRWLIRVVDEGAVDADSIRKRFAMGESFEGIRGKISFNRDRVNPFIRLMEFKNGRIMPIR